MAQSENNLGAPTEGLGQNVTFAYNIGAGVPQLEAGDPGRIRAGVIGGDTTGAGNTQGVGVQATKNPTLDVLMKVGNDIIKPIMERKRTEAFVSGMQRAMQGEAVTEIAATQPWYSKIFGDSDVIEGARAYTGNTTAQTVVASMEDKMPELRKMDAATAQKFFIDAVTNAQTGDAPTDLSILQSMTRAMPAIMRRQAKEHYGYQQERATAAEDASFKSGADLLQKQGSAMAGGYVTPEDFAAAQKQYIRSQMPALGRDETNWKAAQTARYVEAAKLGKFHAVNAGMTPLEEGGPSVIDTLDADQRARINSAVEAGQATLRNKYSMEWSTDLAMIEAQAKLPPTGTTTNDLAKIIDGMNTKFQQETGSKAPFILPRERAAYLSGSTVAIQRDYAHQAKEDAAKAHKLAEAGNKQASADLETMRYKDAVTRGRVGTLVAQPGYSAEKANVVVMQEFRQAPTPEAQDALLMRMHLGDNFVSDPIKNAKIGSFNTALAAGALTDQTRVVIEDARRLYNRSPETFDRYYGDLAPRISGYLNDVDRDKAVPEGAFIRRFVDTKAKALSNADMKVGIEAVTGEYNSFLPWGKKLQPGQARHLASAIGGTASAFAEAGNGDTKAGFVRAMKARDDIEIQGGYVFRNTKGQTPLAHYLNSTVGPAGERPVAGDNTDDAFKGAVEFLLYGDGDKAGVLASKASDVLVYRMPDDKAGVPQFTLAANVDGEMHRAHLSAKDIYKFSDKHRSAARRIADAEATGPRKIEAEPGTAAYAREKFQPSR